MTDAEIMRAAADLLPLIIRIAMAVAIAAAIHFGCETIAKAIREKKP